jgi:hypothetical protein
MRQFCNGVCYAVTRNGPLLEKDMPVPALALVGFMDEQLAVAYLSQACIPPDLSQGALLRTWRDATERLGTPADKAGHPEALDLPSGHEEHLQAIPAHPRFVAAFANVSWSLKLVEIDPLLAFQFHIETDRSSTHAAPLGEPTRLSELLSACLPLSMEAVPTRVQPIATGVIVSSRSTNFRLLASQFAWSDPEQGINTMGPLFGAAPPWVLVSRFHGRCYLSNGFHRAYGLRRAGATHIPCVFQDVADEKVAGIQGEGTTFGLPLLESENAPTLAHFTQGRALPVNRRLYTKVIHISWSEYAVPEPD